MANLNLKVYLDHLIPRDNLLYRRAATVETERTGDEPYLKIEHLMDTESSRADLLRKPDFQRATWAWTPDDCVSLLESVIKERVVPSVILWLNPEQLWYVLDGGHRISVLLAWIHDDWGDRRPSEDYKDATLERNSRIAGKRVRELLRQRGIGLFSEYLSAHRRYRDLKREGGSPELEMGQVALEYAALVRRWQSINMGFPILWVRGDYEKAEESFLKINKTGRQLSPWETTLVETRQSSFARAVMSVSRVADKAHCWPSDSFEIRGDVASQRNVREILKMVQELHDLVFEPPYETPLVKPQQPLLATPFTRPELQPNYLAELLTIAEGHKGQLSDMRKLLQRDARDAVPAMIANGHRLLKNALDVLGNIAGSSPRSLNLMPLVYSYNSYGTFVRSLLYGMVYWIGRGTETDTLARKRLFTAHRGAFESVLLENKDRIINRIARRIGSGTEVTYQTALYYDGLLKLLIQHNDQITSDGFRGDHDRLIETLSAEEKGTDTEDVPSASRVFRGRQRSIVTTRSFVDMFRICPICGGRFYPNDSTQVDHAVPHAKGGPTIAANGRETHPFCNNQRTTIEEIKAGSLTIKLPIFEDPKTLPKPQQLSFLFFTEDSPTGGIVEADELEAAAEDPNDDEVDEGLSEDDRPELLV